MEDLEQYTRINNLIITRHKIKSHAYTAVGEMDANSTEQQAAAFLNLPLKGCVHEDILQYQKLNQKSVQALN